MPTRHLIYKDKTGTSVHFEKAGSRACRLHYNFYPERLILHWRSGGQKARDHGSGDQLPEGQISGGQRASINFTSAIKSKINEDVEEEVRSNEDYSDAMMAEMLEMLHLCLRSNKVTSAKDLEASYKRELDRERRNKKRGKRWRRQNESTDPELYLCGQPLDIHQHNEAIALRDAVFLTFICNVDLYTMFIRTDSKENFLDYRLERRSEGPADRFQVLPNYQLDQTDAQYLLVCTQDRPKELDIYNSAGELVQTLTKMIAEEDSLVFCCPCLVGHDLLAISRNRVSVWKHRIGEEDDGIYYRRRSESQDLSSRLQAKSGTEKQKVLDLKVVGRDIQNEGKLLAVQTTLGVCFLHPRFMTLVPIAVETKRETACPISDDGKMVVGEFSTVKVLSEKSYTDPDSHRVAVSLDNNLLVFDITVTGGDNSTTMKLVSSYSLPGLPLEVCFVGKHDILLTVGQHRETHSLYRDHLFHFSLDGPLNGVLMCLGRGPRSFLPVYLHGNRDAGQCQLEAGWHVYMRDGHGGIICVRL